MELGGVGWFTSFLSEVHNEMFGVPIRWNYEISRFEATRERRSLPKGWSTVWNANPVILLKRKFDKVICLQKSLEDAIYSNAIYHHPDKPFEWLMRQNPAFFMPIKEKWMAMEKHENLKNERFRFVHLDYLNRFPKKGFNDVLDFLEFPKQNRPSDEKLFGAKLKSWFNEVNVDQWEWLAMKLIHFIENIRPIYLPIKCYRDWECYSNISRNPGDQFHGQIPKIKELYLQDLKLKMKELIEKIGL